MLDLQLGSGQLMRMSIKVRPAVDRNLGHNYNQHPGAGLEARNVHFDLDINPLSRYIL